MEVSEEDLAAFNNLVQDGLIEVVRIEDGIPYYRIASEFAGPLETTGPLGVVPALVSFRPAPRRPGCSLRGG
jgi:hypothetical protein